MKKVYDIAIIGSGPAGATLARLVGEKYSVAIIEKRNLKDPSESAEFPKCCGGLLAPDAQEMMSILGLGVPKDVLIGPQIFSVKTLDFDNELERYYQRHYINLDREKFDRWLVSLLPSSVKLECSSIFKSVEEEGNNFKINFVKKGKKRSLVSKIVIGADGAFSKVRRQAFPQIKMPPQYISIQEWFKIKEEMPAFYAIFDREVTDFYSWIIPEEDTFLLGTAVKPGNQAVEKYNVLKKKLAAHNIVCKNPVRKSGAYILRPESAKEIFTGNKRICLIGEAAGFISPSSAEGFSYAFKSAMYLAEALYKYPDSFEKHYENYCRSLKRNVVLKNIKSIAMYNPFLRKIIMKTGVLSLKPFEN